MKIVKESLSVGYVYKDFVKVFDFYYSLIRDKQNKLYGYNKAVSDYAILSKKYEKFISDFESRRKKKLKSDVELASFVYTLFDIFGDFKYVGEVYFK